ncbi:MAG: DUF3299 domain-containing protein [Hyphomonadaceae bacterium]
MRPAFQRFTLCCAALLAACSAPAPAPGAESEDSQSTAAAASLPPPRAAATSGSDETSGGQPSVWRPEKDGPETLIWEDLLPPGEEEHLNQLYEDFYRTLDQRLATGQDQTSNEPTPTSQTQLTSQDRIAGQVRTTQPGGAPSGIAEGSRLDAMPQLGTFNTVADLNGLKVRMPGFVVPIDFNADNAYAEFLLVPYQGACIHTPPPPPNQIVYVKADKPVEIPDIWDAYWVEGVMSTNRHENDRGDAAYTLSLTKLSRYER